MARNGRATGSTRIAFLFIGGAHQVLHAAPAAAELSADRRFTVECRYLGDDTLTMLERVRAAWPAAVFTSLPLKPLRWPVAALMRFLGVRKLKFFYLWRNRRDLARYDAVVVTERTSSILKRMGVRCMIHLPHGAGDRAMGFEHRIRRFDQVIVSGAKDAARMMAEGVVRPERCAVSGAVKLGAVARFSADTASQRMALFGNDRPVVLYNPHFDGALGSWPVWGWSILEAFAAQSDFNLIFAPHIRMCVRATAAERASLAALSVPGRILVDPGSLKSCDMSYTLAADIYLGDVSSQIYEFLMQPRPCVFLNAHGVAWRQDPSYACWHLGEVVDNSASVMTAVARASVRHEVFLSLQRQAMPQAVGLRPEEAPARAAALIRDFLRPGTVPAG